MCVFWQIVLISLQAFQHPSQTRAACRKSPLLRNNWTPGKERPSRYGEHQLLMKPTNQTRILQTFVFPPNRCSVSSRSRVAIDWRRSGARLPSKAILSDKRQTLTLPNVAVSDVGTYECLVRNIYGIGRDSAVISVASTSCCNLSGGVALIVWFTTNGMCVKNSTIHICGASKQ